MKNFFIEGIEIGEGCKPFIIAEMSGNHNASLEKALAIVDKAAECGAHAIKLQTYTPDTMTINHSGGLFSINDSKSLWNGRNLYELYQEAHTPWDWHYEIFKRAKEKGIIVFSTPFDHTAVDFLEAIGVSAFKIASFENTDLILLKKVAQTGKPVIMSTGLATVADLEESVNVLRQNGCEKLVLLKCTSSYPSSPKNTNLVTIPHLSNLFDVHVGLSDHTLGIGAAIASVSLGAKIIEKHFTISRAEGGVDSAFSIEPNELKLLVEESERAFLSLGHIQYGIQDSEKRSLRFKRSIYVVKDISQGDRFTTENIRIIRPGDGLKPKYFNEILGKKASNNIKRGTPLNWDFI